MPSEFFIEMCVTVIVWFAAGFLFGSLVAAIKGDKK
jgi:hypothetical protein